MRTRFYGQPKRKLGNEKVLYDGIEFDSKKEAKRYMELKLLLKAGQIKNLELQKEYVLLPNQYAPSTEVFKRGQNKGKPKQGQLLERGVSYFADFVYEENGEIVVEDVKGYRDPSSSVYAKFVLKKKMLLYFYGLHIREV